MKIKTLAVAAGISAPLILTGSVRAGFTGISTASKPNAFGLLTVNVYATFDRPGEDHMIAVSGSPMNPLLIEVIGGTFYQHLFGTDRAPSTFGVQTFPSLAFDSFITIGVKMVGAGGQPKDNLTVTPNLSWGNSALACTQCGWAVTPANPQGDPFDPLYFAGDGRVLIGQFSTADGTAIQGTMRLQYISNNVVGQSDVTFFHVPGPGALAMMGVAGLIGTQRRSRHRRTARARKPVRVIMRHREWPVASKW